MQAERLSNLAHLEDHALEESEATVTMTTSSKFHDSGLGSSIHATTAYAATVVSMISSLAEGSRAHIPRLSEDAKKGLPFACDACGKFIKVKDEMERR